MKVQAGSQTQLLEGISPGSAPVTSDIHIEPDGLLRISLRRRKCFTQVRAYADDPVTGYGGAVPGTTLQTSNVTINRYGAFAFPLTVTIPTAIPRDVNLSIFVDVDPNNNVDERKEYDNRARSALTIRVGNIGACGR